VKKLKEKDAAKLTAEYERLVRGLAESGVIVPAAHNNSTDGVLAAPCGSSFPPYCDLFRLKWLQ
jgi:hypothetical protein